MSWRVDGDGDLGPSSRAGRAIERGFVPDSDHIPGLAGSVASPGLLHAPEFPSL